MRSFTTRNSNSSLMHIIIIAIACALLPLLNFAQLGWVQVESPNPSGTRNMIRGISGTSSSDIWVVGSYEETIAYNPYVIEHDLILHWNGNTWQQFPAMQLSGTLDDLWDVEAISVNNVWAAGMYNDFATTRAELLHYDGSSWTNHPLPFITGGSYLNALHAISSTDIWAAGGRSGSPTRPCYTIHYDGNSWTEITVPTVGTYRNVFNDIHGVASNDVWAVGHWTDSYGEYHALAMHWNGSNWTNISLPSSIVTQLSIVLSVRMVSSNDVWAMGYFATGGMFKIHWNGSSWTDITPTNGGGGAFAIVSANNIFSVGGEISHWDGIDWTIVDPLTQLSDPALGATVVFPNGEIWAGGRTIDASGNFLTLVYRSVNNVPSFAGGGSQSLNVVTSSANNSISNLLLTLDADVAQALTYTLVVAPAHGTVSGLPASAITNNGSAIPTGVSYTPTAGFTGTDQFVVRVAVGAVNSETTITVNVFDALPVTLTEFKVSKEGPVAVLQWSTAEEFNSNRFEVEHSLDGIHFAVAGIIAARGNSRTANYYRYIHQLPVPGRNFYRLRLVDIDGMSTIFPVKSVQFEAGTLREVVLLSNLVVSGQINLRINATGKYLLTIYNTKGQRLLGKQISNTSAGSSYTLLFPNAAAGIYVLQVSNGLQLFSFKLMVK